MIHERNRHTDGQTDRHTPHDDIGCACIASRSKNRSTLIKVMNEYQVARFLWPTVYIQSPQGDNGTALAEFERFEYSCY